MPLRGGQSHFQEIRLKKIYSHWKNDVSIAQLSRENYLVRKLASSER